jgi:hypothetical protein
MPWTQGPRGIFSPLPPAEYLPEEIAAEISRFESFLAESKKLRGEATKMRQNRERMRADYESKIADALVENKTKLPPDPLADYDQSIQSLEARSAGNERAAAQVYARIGDAMIATKRETLLAAADRLDTSTTRVVEALEEIRPLLDDVSADTAYYRWCQRIEHSASGYAAASPESRVIDQTTGALLSMLRGTRAEIAQRRERL